MSEPGDLGVRLILATRQLERLYAKLDWLRSAAILWLASDEVLDRFNAWAYGEGGAYDPRSESFRRELFPWEEHVPATFFPKPPSRVLVGGAGAGREPLCLAERGHDVVAFEPSGTLADSMAAEALARDLAVDVYRGGYEDADRLTRLRDGSIRSLSELGRFDAAIAGWGSLSHIRTGERRVEALSALAGATTGPLLVSFIAVRPDGELPATRGLRRKLLARHGREPEDRFSMHTGFQHPVNESEVRTAAAAAGLDVLELNFGGDTLAPYTVLRGAGERRGRND